MINWKVRFKNKLWVMAFISQFFILVEVMLVGAHAAGFTDFQLTDEIKGWVLTLVTSVFGILSTLGVVQDPTTKGLEDSEKSLNYNK